MSFICIAPARANMQTHNEAPPPSRRYSPGADFVGPRRTMCAPRCEPVSLTFQNQIHHTNEKRVKINEIMASKTVTNSNINVPVAERRHLHLRRYSFLSVWMYVCDECRSIQHHILLGVPTLLLLILFGIISCGFYSTGGRGRSTIIWQSRIDQL